MINPSAVIDSINIGIIILESDMTVSEWNNWMYIHSGMSAEDVRGKNIHELYPELNKKSFLRGCRTVFSFGNMVFLSSKLHKYLFPFKLEGTYSAQFEYMQQSCYLIPIKDEAGKTEKLMINIYDVTENALLEKHLKELSFIDALTGIYNRRTFEHRLTEEYKRHTRDESPLGIIMFDIDHFKQVNDTYGHPFGDVVLQKVAKACKHKLRTEDFLARYGGEEFVCLLINQNLEQTVFVAERLRECIEELEFECNGAEIKVSISLGAACSVDSDSYTELLKNSDKALYAAKENGRNRTEQYIP